MKFLISVTIFLTAATFVSTNTSGYRSEHYVRVSGDFFCHGAEYEGSVDFMQDKGSSYVENHIGTGHITYGSLEYIIAAYDDIINPLLDIYLTLDFDCGCKKTYTSDKSPRSAKVDSYADVATHFWKIGYVELSKLC